MFVLFSIVFWINAFFAIAVKDNHDLMLLSVKTTMGLMIAFAVGCMVMVFKGQKNEN